MELTELKGTFTVIVTPFHEDGSLNLEGLRENLRFQLDAGVDGIVALGTTGEAPTLSKEEQELVIKETVAVIGGRVPVIVGTGSYCTRQTIENSVKAEKLGADGVMVVTPYYNKPTQEGLYRHFESVAKAVKVPVILYNIQGRTGQNLATSTLKRLMEVENIVGVKEASGSIQQIMDVLECARGCRPDFKVFSGDDVLTLSVVALGGHGIFSVASNLVPGEVKALTDAALKGDMEEARDWHYRLMSLFKAMFIETNPVPVKAAMAMAGMAAGPCRLPLCELKEENERELRKAVMKLTELNITAYK